ncbi:MAG: FHA domain-containing protein, partial [Candidatus Promineifilaceae bacterium]|nr:FHA domain-containing protein [Candidatus Promineifilaceae bacterium]
IQVSIVDELGQQATSPPVTLSVLQGQTEVPEAIQAGGLLDSLLGRLVLACAGALALLGLLGLVVYLVRRRRNDDLPPPETELLGPEPLPRRDLGAEMTYVGGLSGDQAPEAPQAAADEYERLAAAPYLEILRSVTRMPPLVELGAVEHRLGRSPVHNDIVLENDITVSRVHASIVREGEHYRIYDESSTSGTLVNDRPVPDYGHQLRDGDEIRLGAVLIRYRQ